VLLPGLRLITATGAGKQPAGGVLHTRRL